LLFDIVLRNVVRLGAVFVNITILHYRLDGFGRCYNLVRGMIRLDGDISRGVQKEILWIAASIL